MSKPRIHAYSRYAQEATSLLGKLIRSARKERHLTTQEVADRAGISRGLLQRIEKGELTCGIGTVFEVAALVEIKLFDADQTTLTKYIRQADEKLSLLPISIRKINRKVDDSF